MWRILILAAGLLLVATGCGAGGSTDTAVEPVQASDLYETNATVLEQGEGMAGDAHGPELCVGGIDLSLPPQCGGPSITNWDWAAVDGEERRAGTTWGEYHLVGTFDGESFTVTSTGPVPAPPTMDEDDEFEAHARFQRVAGTCRAGRRTTMRPGRTWRGSPTTSTAGIRTSRK